MTNENMTRCPKCGEIINKAIIHTSGIVVCSKEYIDSIIEIEKAEKRGESVKMHGGLVNVIVPMIPLNKEKYIYCQYCKSCELIIVEKGEIIDIEKIVNESDG